MKSIKIKLLLVIISILVGFTAILILSNHFFLDDYYVYQTEGAFVDANSKVEKIIKDKKTDTLTGIRDIDEETEYKIVIANDKGEIVHSSVPEFNGDNSSTMTKSESEVIKNNNNFKDNNYFYGVVGLKDNQFVMLVNKVDKNNFIIISQPLSQISESAKIANNFFIILGLAMLVIASFISVLFATKLVSPILEITKIADRIAMLDFSSSYRGNSNDEIGTLGSSINNISQKLSTSINNLKLNNEQLIKEMKLQKRFVASVSHEFNTPVGLIRGYTEALDKRMYENEYERKEIINIIIKEADRLNHLVNDILLILRFDSKSFNLNKKDINITRLINDCINKSSFKIEKKNLSVTNFIEKDIILSIDELRITQVVDNILSNAINHVNESGKITIDKECVDDNIKFSISNTGSYINDDDKRNIFDAFYRVEDSRNRKLGGNGLGLSIVKGIVEAHGGICYVEDIEDGVKFCFTFPIARS